LSLDETITATTALMVRLYKAEVRSFYAGTSDIDESAVEQVLGWANSVRAATLKFCEAIEAI
jgi:hypothetical protein